MPAKGNKHVTKESGGKRKQKRKAKSPLLTDSGQARETGSDVGGVSGSNVNKRQLINVTDLSASPINTIPNMTSPTPQYPQQYSPYANYGTTMTQNPQFFQPVTPIQTPVHSENPKPSWAQEILDELKRSTTKIDRIDKTVDTINNRMTDIEKKMKDMEKRTTETEKACAFIGETTEAHTSQLAQTKAEMNKIQTKCKTLNNQVLSLQTERDKLSTKITDLEYRSMRDNLVFYGLNEQRDENCETKVKELIKDKLGLQADIKFDRVHRIGQTSGAKPRPIVAKFHDHKQREEVRQKAYDSRNILKELSYGVGVQYPKEVRETRKLLFPVMKKAESEGKIVKLVGDKLFINHSLYVPPNDKQTTD